MARRQAVGLLAVCLSVVAVGVVAWTGITTPSPSTPTLPPVTVTAPRIGGGNVLCRGDGCAGMLDAMKEQINMEFLTQGLPIQDDPPVSGQQFCNNLKALKPSGCNGSNPPPSPGISVPGKPAWQPNGCGTGGMANWFVDLVLEVTASQSYSGNLNSPYQGVSFQGACNSHDQCWAMGGSRGVCDLQFRDSMNTACGQLGDAGSQATCMGFASNYHGAVSTTNASNSAYANSVQGRICAIWANDMRENNCAF